MINPKLYLFFHILMYFWLRRQELCPHTKDEGGHISFSADPACRCRRDSLVSTISLESLG